MKDIRRDVAARITVDVYSTPNELTPSSLLD